MSASNAGGQGVEAVDQTLTNVEVAQLLRVSVHTLARWRCDGTGPPFLKLGGGRTSLIRYRRSEVLAYLERATRRSTVDPGDGA